MEKDRIDKRLLLGIIIVLTGLLLLAKNFGFIGHGLQHYIFRWEMILIVLGLIFITNRSNRSTGIILLFIGGAFYVADIWNLHLNFWQLFLPSLLILAGVMIIFKDKINAPWGKTVFADDENHIDETAVFGGGDRVVRSQNFKGGKVTAVFGGLNYDMLKARLEPGQNVIDVFCLFGGMKLVIPDDWNIKIRVTSIFGGFSDKRHITSPEKPLSAETQLTITGLAIFGGGEIASYFD
jgi:predicted membrane protein